MYENANCFKNSSILVTVIFFNLTMLVNACHCVFYSSMQYKLNKISQISKKKIDLTSATAQTIFPFFIVGSHHFLSHSSQSEL